jgi:hypothetical protein
MWPAIAIAMALCLIGSAIAWPNSYPLLGPEPIAEQRGKKGKGPHCFAKCIAKGKAPQRCNTVCR